jgi:imidazolonepropionase-like amidohydrolase
MQESQILIQLIYLPMLFLSGATFPSEMFPGWLQSLTSFLPATHLVTGIQGMLLSEQSLLQKSNLEAALALVLTTLVGLFIAYKLFRWEKEEKVKPASKLWLLAIMLPFLVIGAINVRTHQNRSQQRILARQLARGETFLIRGARIFVGDGRVIEQGAVLVRGGKIAEVYEGAGPDPRSVNAEVVEAAGKTILPGLIDVHIHLGAPGGIVDWQNYNAEQGMERELAAYLYSGVTAVRSTGDVLGAALKVRGVGNSGEKLGAEFFTCGPLFTAKGGHGTEYFTGVPQQMRQTLESQFVRIPGSPDDAKQQVDELKRQGVDCIKGVLEAGAAGHLFNRLDPALLASVGQEAKAQQLPLAVHTGDAHDVADALGAQASSIEHGSMRDAISDEVFEKMAREGVSYDPTLFVGEAFRDLAAGRFDLLKRPLVQQVGPPDLIKHTEAKLSAKETEDMRKSLGEYPMDQGLAAENLRRAYQHRVTLVAGSDAGNLLVIHGPTVQHELELWVKAGIPTAVALQAATYNAAKLLRAENRIGLVQPGHDADLLIVDGNPLEDISATERISSVVFKGERIDRASLFDQR